MIQRRTIFTRLRHALFAVAAVALPSALRGAQAKETAPLDRKAMLDLFDRHVNAELAGNLDVTMAIATISSASSFRPT